MDDHPEDITLGHFNAQSLSPKEELVKKAMATEGVTNCGVCETWVYKNGGFSDKDWIWNSGPEIQPESNQSRVSRGMGTFTKRGCTSAVVHVSENLMASRLEGRGTALPIYTIECHFPKSDDSAGHVELWGRVNKLVTEYEEIGHIVLMGDFNAHAKANGDERLDTAGRRMVANIKTMRLEMVNKMKVCEGKFSWFGYNSDTQTGTTIDYVFVSQSLVGKIKCMKLGQTLGSDHRFVTLRLSGLAMAEVVNPTLREVWKVENLPRTPEETTSFVEVFQQVFEEWTESTRTQMQMLEALGVEYNRVVDLVEWSFQVALDKGAAQKLGTKRIGPRATPMLDSAMRVLNGHRLVCETALRRIVANGDSTVKERSKAVELYRDAKSALFQATRMRKEKGEQQTFRQIEEKQSDSKLFWARANKITGRMRKTFSPPPLVMNEEGKVESDPIEVLRIWRRFSAEVADMTPSEEGMYDEEFKESNEKRLEYLRQLRIEQPKLDEPITAAEVFRAIRRMKMGKAAGVDGILSSVIRHAADAVGTNKLKPENSVVDALVLMFNYVFYREEWPERWGSGIIFPLYKQDGRLEPGNYRPITLLSIIGKLFGSVVEARLSDWSEATGAISDEQGGFRRERGTPDQIFLLREIITSRKERNLPTLVTYIDARKAYDTVWREGNYVRLFDMGLQGKMWRQIQAMGARMRSKVRLGVGETEWHEVKRGVAQGAVESPWLYSCYIDGMTAELKARGLGVQIAGIRVPLLMYADDIVMLASSVTELKQMNQVATDYAFKYRFRHNGEKSAVMAFNADKRLQDRMNEEVWTLSGERVEVKDKYKYLGVDVMKQVTDWRAHVERLVQKAKFRSNDLLWVCKSDAGIRPRSAATLWKAMVRPVLEYAAELWSGEVPRDLAQQAEKIQTDFARGVLGLQGYRGVADVLVRAELGLEKLSSRWEKLRLGYWRRIQVAKPNRALAVVARARRWQCMWGGAGIGRLSWMVGTRRLLRDRGLAEHWNNPDLCTLRGKEEWRKKVYERVEAHYEEERESEVARLSSLTRYTSIKSWARVGKDRAEFKGEVGKLGALVVERYLDEVKDRLGAKLKQLCRAGCLPVMARIAWELGISPEHGKCMMCWEGEEDIEHVLLSCQAYSQHRAKLMTTVWRAYSRGNSGANIFEAGEERLIAVLLGARAGCKLTEDGVDRAVQRFLRKVWKARRAVTAELNQEFGRTDVQWIAREPGWFRPRPNDPTRAKCSPVVAQTSIAEAQKGPIPGHDHSEKQRQGRGKERKEGARRKLILI